MKVLLIDNYDSFTYNLSHLLTRAGADVTVVRNDQDFLADLNKGLYDAAVIGPGPGTPDDVHYFGKNNEVITKYGAAGLPILGVCLGFQGIAVAFGAKLRRAAMPIHGKLSELKIISADEIFKDIPDRIEVMRYHSLMIDPNEFPTDQLIVTSEVMQGAESVEINGREIMSIRHVAYPIYGVQFHPESFATELGLKMVQNFLNITRGVS